MYTLFSQIIETIQDNLSDGKKVLLHCPRSTQPSYTIVAAYLMWLKAHNVKKAISYIVEWHPEAFNSSTHVKFKQALEYWTKTKKHIAETS